MKASDVELQGVSRLFGDFRAVDDVSFQVMAGEFLSLLGASGAGKSTVLRMIGGFDHPDTGVIRIGGTDVTPLPPYRRDVNTVFQHYALFPHMNVAENVAYGLRQERVPTTERRTRVRDALDMVRLLPLSQRRPDQLSGGQQQRVALARALVKRPSVLLLDEPLGALDRRLRQQMQVELKLLQNELGLTFVFVTHDQEEALAMSDRIAVMRDGRIEQLGSPTELYDRPINAFAANFIGLQNFFEGRVDGSTGRLEFDSGAAFTGERAAQGVGAGERGLGAVRPENVQISATEPAADTNKSKGRVAAVVMLGDVLEYIVVLASGMEVVSRSPRGRDEPWEKGHEVWVHWMPQNAMIFPFDETVMRERELSSRMGGKPEPGADDDTDRPPPRE